MTIHRSSGCKCSRKMRRRDGWSLLGFAVGAASAYLFDPKRGRSRRRMARERSLGTVRHAARDARRSCRTNALQALGHAKGVWHRLLVVPMRGEPLDDAGLAHKVESILFRDTRVPKGRISINAEDGAVFLRGELDTAELIADIARATGRIPGVTEVVNLLHPPGTEAPHPPVGDGSTR